jgi:hypothetical protein
MSSAILEWTKLWPLFDEMAERSGPNPILAESNALHGFQLFGIKLDDRAHLFFYLLALQQIAQQWEGHLSFEDMYTADQQDRLSAAFYPGWISLSQTAIQLIPADVWERRLKEEKVFFDPVSLADIEWDVPTPAIQAMHQITKELQQMMNPAEVAERDQRLAKQLQSQGELQAEVNLMAWCTLVVVFSLIGDLMLVSPYWKHLTTQEQRGIFVFFAALVKGGTMAISPELRRLLGWP